MHGRAIRTDREKEREKKIKEREGKERGKKGKGRSCLMEGGASSFEYDLKEVIKETSLTV